MTMPPKQTPSLYPYLAAALIETSTIGGTVDAIRFITQEELKNLKNSHQKKLEISKIVDESKKREAQILREIP